MQFLHVIKHILYHFHQLRKHIGHLLPDRQHQPSAKTQLILVKLVQPLEGKMRSHCQPKSFLAFTLLVELKTDKHAPVEVLVEVETRIADVAGVKQLLHDKLCYLGRTIE